MQLKTPNYWPEELMHSNQLKEFFFSPDCSVCGFIPQNLLKGSLRSNERGRTSREVSPGRRGDSGSPRMPQLLQVLRNAHLSS